jgi:hypothetical protein
MVNGRHWGGRNHPAIDLRVQPRDTTKQDQRKDLVAMNEEITSTETPERMPFMQRVLDNPFILLFVGIVFPAVFYIIWGIIEIVNIPIAQ